MRSNRTAAYGWPPWLGLRRVYRMARGRIALKLRIGELPAPAVCDPVVLLRRLEADGDGEPMEARVMQRRWAVVVLMATALLVYLVMPNQAAPVPGAAAPGGNFAVLLADLAQVQDGLGRGEVTSDEVTVPPRSSSQEHPPADQELLTAARTDLLVRDAAMVRGSACGDAALPVRDRLEILRC